LSVSPLLDGHVIAPGSYHFDRAGGAEGSNRQMTNDWKQFIESLEGGGRDWVKNVDLTALGALKDDELEQALLRLLVRLQAGDARAARALGTLQDARIAPALEARLSTATGRDQVATAASLLHLVGAGGSPQALRIIRSALSNPDQGVATEAVDASVLVGRPVVEALLTAAFRHPVSNVRVGAIKRALFITGVNKSPGSWEHRDEIVALVNSEPIARRQAFATLCQRMGIDLQTYLGPRP
jgi:hypothetical protein